MVFFDLNIPIEDEPKDINKAKSAKDTRVKLVVKAMELGYSGIAFNRSITGVMSDSDRCTITPLPLPSLLEASPALAETVRFHREVLGVPVGETFKQYTRLTVIVESMLQAAAISPVNPVLRGYDLVAVRPMDQQTFEHACNNLEVDLISIDFSQGLTFRFKRAIVKAAMERGIFFEIIYSPAISNFHARREIFASTKVLLYYTRGRNIIVSSAASRVNELRGPNDVANMSTLFGLSMEHARAAVSKNCRTVILHGFHKKCYKSAIQVENHSPDGIFGSDKAWFNVSEVWDPISSGDGDLVLKTNLPVLKTNMVENGQPYNKKGPSSRAKKRRRASSSQSTGVLLPDDNKRMGLNTRTSILPDDNKRMGLNTRTSTCGLQLDNASLHTGTMAKQKTNVTISDADTHMEELKSRMQNIDIPQATPYGVSKFNLSDAVEFLALDGNRHQLAANRITWATEYESHTDQGATQQSSISICKDDTDPVNGTGITTPGLPFNSYKGPSVAVVHTDALQACNKNSFLSDDTTCLVDIISDESTIGSMVEEGILVSGSGIMVDGIESRENRKLITELDILQRDFISNDALMDTTMSMGAEDLTAVCSKDASEMELDSKTGTAAKHNTSVTISDVDICMEELKSRLQNNDKPQATPYGDNKFNFCNGMEVLVLDDNGHQLLPRGITQVTEYKSTTDQQVTQQSSVVNCDADVDPVNGTGSGITPPGPSFNSDKGPLVTVVHTQALQVCNESSLPSDHITSLVDISSDGLCNSNTQITLPESKINDGTIGNMMEQVILVSGSGVKVDGLNSRENKRLLTEPNKHQGDFILDDALMDMTMPTVVGEELTAVCSKGASELELNCKTGTEGKLQRKKLPRVHFLSFRGILKSVFFKKRVLPRKRNSRK